MINQFEYRSSRSRLTKQQERDIQTNRTIVEYIQQIQIEKDAESLWTELKSLGVELSISAFNTRLKKLVELGLVKKRSLGYNKHLYSIFPGNQ